MLENKKKLVDYNLFIYDYNDYSKVIKYVILDDIKSISLCLSKGLLVSDFIDKDGGYDGYKQYSLDDLIDSDLYVNHDLCKILIDSDLYVNMVNDLIYDDDRLVRDLIKPYYGDISGFKLEYIKPSDINLSYGSGDIKRRLREKKLELVF